MARVSIDFRSRFSRREILAGSAAAYSALAGCAPGLSSFHEEAPQRALQDPSIVHGKVTFAGAQGLIGGYLARPNGRGRYPAVIVVAGNTIAEEYIPNTTALLARGGFVGLAPDIFSLQTDSMSPDERRRVFDTQITDERIFSDCEGGMRYLEAQPFARRGRMGATGFCFGGRTALLLAARNADIAAVVSFYGNLVPPPGSTRATPFDVITRIRVPVQGHYATDDASIAIADVRRFETALRAAGTPAEMHLYDARHGFFAYTRPVYDAAAADLSRRRMLRWFQRYLA